MCVYIYTYIYIYTHIYIYVHIERERESIWYTYMIHTKGKLQGLPLLVRLGCPRRHRRRRPPTSQGPIL